jgi:hypothetical protein
MGDIERYEDWKARMEREGVPDPPVIFAGNWARKAIEDLEAERASLRQQLEGAVSEVERAHERLTREGVPTHDDHGKPLGLALRIGVALDPPGGQ